MCQTSKWFDFIWCIVKHMAGEQEARTLSIDTYTHAAVSILYVLTWNVYTQQRERAISHNYCIIRRRASQRLFDKWFPLFASQPLCAILYTCTLYITYTAYKSTRASTSRSHSFYISLPHSSPSFFFHFNIFY